MSVATCRKVGSFTRQDAQFVREQKKKGVKFVELRRNSEGVEIYDARGLADVLNNPINGRGIVRCLGQKHFVVTESKLEKLLAA